MLSADGSTVYVNGRDEHLWAINTADGKPKWSVPLDYLAQTPPSVSPDGLIVAGGGPGARAGRRSGTAATTARWCGRAATSTPLTTASAVGRDVAYTVARDGENGQALLVFDPADGHTVNSYPLPNATGWPVGVSVGHDRRVVTATSDGQVYGFAPRDNGGYASHRRDRVARRPAATPRSRTPADLANISPWPKKKISESSVSAKFW